MVYKLFTGSLYFRALIFISSSYGFLISPVVHASVDYFDLDPEQLLSAQVLSVSKKSESVADSAAAVFVVTSEDISRSGVTTIPDALRMVPGVDVARSDSNSWAISIRGFNSNFANKLLVMIDGRTIYNPLFGGVLWEAQDLMLEDIARIEVIRGPGGSLWGANAVNGVINIITKHTRDTQGTLVSAIAGNEERGTFSARQGGTFGEDGSYRVYAKGFDRDSSLRPDGSDAYDAWDGVRAGFRTDWGDTFTLQGDAYRNDTEQRRPLFSIKPPFADLKDQTLVYEGINLLGRWTDKYSDGAQLSVQSYIDWARRDEPYNLIDNRKVYDIEMQYNFQPFVRQEIISGIGLRYLTDDETGNENVAFSPPSRHNTIYSAFLQDKIALINDRLFLTLGSKFEHNDFSGFEAQPNIRLQWHASQSQSVWAAVSSAVRTPTPLEESLTSTALTTFNTRIAFVPNHDFQSEKLKAYELGYRNQITSTLSADLAAFYNRYDRLETYAIRTPYPVVSGINPPYIFIPVQFTNDMQGKSSGFETALNWSVSSNLRVAFNYSYLYLSVHALDPTQETPEDLYPRHQAGTHIFWNLCNSWTLDTSVAYVDELPGNKVDDYVRLDINIGGQITKKLRFNLVGQNLLDRSHREFGSATDINVGEIERSIFGKVTWAY